jgi:hypothetical protein
MSGVGFCGSNINLRLEFFIDSAISHHYIDDSWKERGDTYKVRALLGCRDDGIFAIEYSETRLSKKLALPCREIRSIKSKGFVAL